MSSDRLSVCLAAAVHPAGDDTLSMRVDQWRSPIAKKAFNAL